MTGNHTEVDLSWRKKYYQALQELEHQEQDWNEKEDLLRTIVSRLTLAADQSDEELNKQFESLRNAVRGDTETDRLRPILDAISDRIVYLDNRSGDIASANDAFLVMTQLLDLLPVPTTLKVKERSLRKRLPLYADKDLRPLIQEFADLISDMIDTDGTGDSQSFSPRSGAKGGVFNRLFGSRNGAMTTPEQATETSEVNTNSESPLEKNTEDEQPPIHRVLIDLVGRLEFPPELNEQCGALIESFSTGISVDEITASVEAVADLAMQARLRLQKEKQEIEDLLRQLTEKLHDLDEYLASRKAISQEVIQHREEFDSRLDDHVRGIEHSVNEATDLDGLRSSLRAKLETIHQNLEEERRSELERNHRAQEEIEDLTSKLESMEQKIVSLRKRIEKERELALHDALTGLFNRLAYDERITQEIARWKRYQRPLSLAVLDIDNFKKVNDTYGHKAGDKVLKLVAELFKAQIRETDFIARYGGEEFVVIMTETELQNARIVVEKLRQAVEAYTFHYRGDPVLVTVSCGYTTLQDGDTQGLAFERADNALYRAKAEGKNRCYANDMIPPNPESAIVAE